MRVLGFDLGTNSIGWALIEYNDEALESIVGAGVRIVPLAPDLKTNFEKGQTISKTAQRRQKRSSRRLNQRFKQRRNNLFKTFFEMGVLDQIPDLDAQPQALDHSLMGRPLLAGELYELRAKAAEEAISLSEFARVIFHLNQRRGYRPTRSEKRQLASKSQVRYGYFKILGARPTGEILSRKSEYEIHLNDGTIGTTPGKELEQLIGGEYPIEITSQKLKNGRISNTIKLIEESDDSWASRLGAMEAEFVLSGQTPGQYFHQKILEARSKGQEFRVRQKLIYRKRYIQEFEKIWQEQAKHHPILSDEKFLARVVEAVCPRQYPLKKSWKKRSLMEFVRDFIIYYQRPLRSQKNNISACTFETAYKKRVIPKSHPLFQEFKIWNQINNLKIESIEGAKAPVSIPQREELFRQLSSSTKLSIRKVAAICACKPAQLSIDKEMEGNSTMAQIKKACQQAGLDWGAFADETIQTRIWHILYSLEEESDETIFKALEEQCGIPPGKAGAFLHLYFPKEYGNLSAKAIKKLLPLMRTGSFFDLKMLHSISEKLEAIIKGEEVEGLEKGLRSRFRNVNSLSDFSGLQYWEAATLVYGSHSEAQVLESFASAEAITPIPQHSLRNPVVEQIINEALQIVKQVWKTYGKPDRIHLELARELRQNARQREKASKQNRSRAQEREKTQKILQEEFNLAKPSRKDIQRYELWMEAGQRCIYSNQSIPQSALFGNEIDIDHIIPQSRYFDDSQINKVIAYASVNRNQKKNLLPFEFIKGTDWEAFQERVSKNPNYSPAKKRLLLAEEVPEGFINRQLQDTSYISRRIRSELEKVCPPVLREDGSREQRILLTSGQITSFLRDIWNLNDSLKRIMLPRYRRLEELAGESLISEVKGRLRLNGFQKRLDHRHHALDAIVVAATRPFAIQSLNRLNQFFENGETGKRGSKLIPLPHPHFRRMVFETLEATIVSHKSRWRLASPRWSGYQMRDSEGKLIWQRSQQAGWSIHGRLHEETIYGKVRQYKIIPVKEAFGRLEEIAVDWQRDRIAARLEQSGADLGKAIRSLKKRPLSDLRGEELKEVTVFEEVTTQVVALPALSAAQVNKPTAFLDRKLGREIYRHVQKYSQESTSLDTKAAFSANGLADFNAFRNPPVFKVKIKVGDKPIELQPENRNKRLVKSGDNFGVWVGEDEGGKRSTEIISFIEAANLIMLQQPLIKRGQGQYGFLLRKGEMVYVLKPDEKPSHVNWSEPKHLSDRIYICMKMSGKQFYFLPHAVAKVLGKEDQISQEEYGSSRRTEFHGVGPERQKIIAHCVKIHIDHLGRIQTQHP